MSRKNPSLCLTPRCMKPHEPGRDHCSACRKRAYRRAHVMEASYQNLRSSAAKRDIFFGLTFDEFSEMAIETEYLKKKGRSKLAYSVDREIEGKYPGYVKSNIRVVPVWYNSAKECYRRQKKYLEYDWQTKTARVITIDRPRNVEMLF